jgi:hypothetical protein
MSGGVSLVDLAAEKVVEVMKIYDPLLTPRWDAVTVLKVLQDATKGIADPADFRVFATALADKIEVLVRDIKMDFRNIEHRWFMNFWTGTYFESVILDFQNLTRDIGGVRELEIEKLTSNEFKSLYVKFVDWLCNAIVNDLRTKSVGDIHEVDILCNQWYRVGRHFNLIHPNRAVLQEGIYSICDQIQSDAKTSFIGYVKLHTTAFDSATPDRPLFVRPAMAGGAPSMRSKLEELSTRVDTLWLRLQNEVI